MRRVAIVAGLLMAGVGLIALLYPPTSVWQVSGAALEELPAPVGDVTDNRNRFALGDPDFVIATRVYHDRAPQEVEDALLAGGFQPMGADELFKDCCGDWDAMVASVSPDGVEGTVVRLTPADTDIQTSWPFFAIVAAALMTGGVGLISFARRLSESTGDPEAVEPEAADPGTG